MSETFGFSPKMFALLDELYIRNSKVFYEEKKEELRRCVVQPMKELAQRLAPIMLEIDPNFDIDPNRCVSRLFRDARRVRDGVMYRDHIWLSFHLRGQNFVMPSIYFEVEPCGYGYGMGLYSANAAQTKAWRDAIDANPARFEQLIALLAAHPQIACNGESYKKEHPSRYEGALRQWYNLKQVHFGSRCNPREQLFDGSFYSRVVNDLQAIAPLYHALAQAARQG